MWQFLAFHTGKTSAPIYKIDIYHIFTKFDSFVYLKCAHETYMFNEVTRKMWNMAQGVIWN